MKTINHKLIKTSLAFLVAATSINLSAETNNSSFKATQKAAYALPTANDADKNRVEFIWPEPQQSVADLIKEQQISSDEYWQTVSGAELMKGVEVYAWDNALVRIAPLATYQSGTKLQSAPLQSGDLGLTGSPAPGLSLEPLASQQDMEAAGFYDGSISLKVNNQSDKTFQLKSQRQLASSAKYLLHVKEKHSNAKLAVTAENRIADGGQRLSVAANIQGKTLIPFATQAKLITPQGESLDAIYVAGKVRFSEPLQQYGAKQGLYEVQLTTMLNVDGKLIKRSAKIPFINTAQTAVLKGQPDIGAIAIQVHEPGRYNIKATLVGTDKQGKSVRLQTAEVAQWMNTDNNVKLPFELEKFGSYKDLKLVDIKLSDQSRLMTLQVLPELL